MADKQRDNRQGLLISQGTKKDGVPNMKVILTTDGSAAAEKAIRWFVRLPLHKGHEYEIVTVVTYEAYNFIATELYHRYRELVKKQARHSFERALAILHESKVDAIHVELVGQPADKITSYANESGADLIVLGSRGASRLARILMMGSTCDAIATHAPCSVLVVRDDVRDLSPDKPLHISLAFDGSEASRDSVTQLQSLCFPSTSKISLISVIEHPPLLDADVPYDANVTRQTEVALQNLADQLKLSFESIETEVIEAVHVGSSILEYLEKSETDIVVVGEKGRSAINRFFMGSVSRFVLSNAHCSVFLSRKRFGK